MDTSHLIPSPVPPHHPYQNPRPTPATSPGFCGCMKAKCQPRPHDWLPLLCVYLGLNPLAVHLHTAGLTYITSLYCSVCICDKILQPWKCISTAKTPTVACGPRFSTISSHWSEPLGSPVARSPSYAPVHPWPDPSPQHPLLCTHPWQDPAAKGVHADSQAHHSCLWAQISSYFQSLAYITRLTCS